MKLADLKVFPIDDSDRFEDFCVDVYKIRFGDNNAQRNGRRGQRQNGVDVFCHEGNPFAWIGVQCKMRNREKKLSILEIKDEIEKAKNFNPRIAKYIVATTCERDSNLQEEIRKINHELVASGFFEVKIDFWEDFQNFLSNKEYEKVLLKYYSDFIVDSLNYGFAIGRPLTILTGIEDNYCTQHELLIGKIPAFDKDEKIDISYFQNRYIVLNLNNRRFSIFQEKCYPSDFEHTIEARFDQELISRWLRHADILAIIYGDDQFYRASFSKQEYIVFLDRHKEDNGE